MSGQSVSENPFRRLVALGVQINDEERARKTARPQRDITQEEFGKLEFEFHQLGAECRVVARKLPGWNAEKVNQAIADCDEARIDRFRVRPDDPPGEDLMAWSNRASNRFTAALAVVQQFADEYDAEQRLGRILSSEVVCMPATTPAPPPIGIREIVVENFRGIPSLELKFLDAGNRASDIVVLGGPNGSGKTSLLEACLLALGHPELIRSPTVSPVVHSGTHRFQITAQVSYGGENAEVKLGGEGMPAKSPRRAWASREVTCIYFSSWRAPKLVGPVPVTAGRRGKRPADTEENRLWLVKQFLVNAKAHALMGGPGQLDGISTFETSLERLNDMWRSFHPGRNQSFSVEAVGDDPDAGFDVVLLERNETRIPLDSLSSGQLELFAFFGAFLRSKFQEGVVVIDEPELHLDPQWHTLMLRAIRKFLPRVQILVATHSPAVFDSVYSFQRHLLLPPGDPRNTAWKARPSEVAG